MCKEIYMNTITALKGNMDMNKILLTMLVAAAIMLTPSLFNAQAIAGDEYFYSADAGYKGPGPAFTTVAEAKKMRDDSKVALKGNIIKSLGGDLYLFQDETGTITVDIDMKIWAGQQVGPEDTVEIYGEVEKEWFETDEIDVKRLIKR